MRNFLYGMLVGCVITAGTVRVVDVVASYNARLRYVEAYIGMLDKLLRAPAAPANEPSAVEPSSSIEPSAVEPSSSIEQNPALKRAMLEVR